MNPAEMHIGVDVGKDKLDVCLPNGHKYVTTNNKKGIKPIIKDAKRLNAIVSFEATGIYSNKLYDACIAAGVRAMQLDPWRARNFAKSQGLLEKTDPIDCEMIRDFAASLKPEKRRFIEPISDSQRNLRTTVRVRRNLMKAKNLVATQLDCIDDASSRKSLMRIVDRLEAEIAKVEAHSDEVIANDERMHALAVRFLVVAGVGPCVTRVILSDVPEIGRLTNKAIGKILGLAPLENKSCTVEKKSRPQRGRGYARSVLYEATMTACRFNHVWKQDYDDMVARGKPKPVAHTAIARKMAILLNTIAKYPDFKPSEPPKPAKAK